MNHYLLTRFNVRSKEWIHTRTGELVLTDEWLDNRFELCKKYCLPSILQQTNKNFKWCIFFDIHTPVNYKQRINNLLQSQKNVFSLFIEDLKHLKASFISFIKESKNTSPFIITSRLDSDDIIQQFDKDALGILAS